MMKEFGIPVSFFNPLNLGFLPIERFLLNLKIRECPQLVPLKLYKHTAGEVLLEGILGDSQCIPCLCCSSRDIRIRFSVELLKAAFEGL